MKRLIPLAVLVLAFGYVAAALWAPAPKSDFDLDAFGRIPVLVNGRLKPLDTVARTSLLVMQGRQRVSDPTISEPLVASPIEWLADVLFNPAKADTYPTFRLSASDSPELVSLMGLTDADTKIHYDSATQRTLAIFDFLPGTRTRFSFKQLEPKLAELDRQAQLAEPIDDQARTPFQRAVIQLRDRVLLYQRLKHSVQAPDSANFLGELLQFQKALPAGIEAVRARQKGQAHNEESFKLMMTMAERYDFMDKMGYLLTVPPAKDEANLTKWKTVGRALLETFDNGELNPNVVAYASMGRTYRDHDVANFNQIVSLYRNQLAARFAPQQHKGDIEVRFNAAEPFYRSMLLYALAFFVAIVSWLKWPDALGKSAFNLVLVAWLLETAGIVVRMWLEGRPPVTNLYSSALFVGWVAVLACLVLEWIFRNAVATVAAGMIGFVTLLIAHHLSLSGDTLEMMRAVLDTNLWLATHVVIVTSGYGATFLAGFLGLIYIIMGVFTPWLAQKPSATETNAKMLERMIYGIVCFATLCSLVGTVLGGIWADQSWGRFWGWDPKENGAVMIVLWNAIFLHARWGGLVKPRGLACLAIGGNIITSWSWFGTNMLGVGLHSYGFMDSAFPWLIAFVASQLALIALAQIPLGKWRSFRA